MAITTIDNLKSAPALRGQSVKITVDTITYPELKTYLLNLPIGTLCSQETSGSLGVVASVDRYGDSFEITPNVTDDSDLNDPYFYGGTKGLFLSTEQVRVNY